MMTTEIILAGKPVLALQPTVYTPECIEKAQELVTWHEKSGAEIISIHESERDTLIIKSKVKKRFRMVFNIDDKKYTYTTDYQTYKKLKQKLKDDGDAEVRINGRIRNFRHFHYSHMEEDGDKIAEMPLDLTDAEREKRKQRRDEAYKAFREKMGVDISKNQITN